VMSTLSVRVPIVYVFVVWAAAERAQAKSPARTLAQNPCLI
jgi:hypothetical protein